MRRLLPALLALSLPALAMLLALTAPLSGSAGANAQPVSYTVNNKQYVAMGCGGNVQLDFKRGNSLFVYTLGD